MAVPFGQTAQWESSRLQKALAPLEEGALALLGSLSVLTSTSC